MLRRQFKQIHLYNGAMHGFYENCSMHCLTHLFIQDSLKTVLVRIIIMHNKPAIISLTVQYTVYALTMTWKWSSEMTSFQETAYK